MQEPKEEAAAAPVLASFGLEGRRALITGASSGLGLHFARVLADAGAEVVLAARRGALVEAAAADIRDAGGLASAIEMDVTDQASVTEAVDRAGAIDILVNNAGITGSGAAIDMDREDFAGVVEVNLVGSFAVARAVARGMRERGGGAIVNIGSILAHRVAGQVVAYAASKAALVQTTRALALEWARYGIRVNALCPGYVETPLNAEFFASEAGKALIRRIPQRRLGQPEDLDGPLLLLCSDAGRFMTGTSLVVDGGHLVSSV